MAYISAKDGKYTIAVQPHKISSKTHKPVLIKPNKLPENMRPQENSEDDESNQLWIISKYTTVNDKTNEFHLTGGETLKLGRVKFVVKEI